MGSGVETFDYIIVGGGTAGLTVANRLTEDADVNVLVIEAGQDRSRDALVLTPGLVAGLYGKPEYDWNFHSTPQPGLNNRIISQPRGKQLGGTSAINFAMVLFPPKGSLDAWAALGNQGWDYDSLSPYLSKFATVHPPPQTAKDVLDLSYHDDSVVGNGPVHVSYSEGFGQPNAAWMETFANLGFKMETDPRTGKGLGAFQQGISIDPATNTRSYAATAHYTPEIASRPNLTVMTETTAKKIVFDTSKAEPVAIGVLVRSKDGIEKMLLGGEIILAAGALMSPQILELSGIGNRPLLESLDIPVIVENANVGENLQDHPITCQSFEVNPEIPSGDVLRDANILNALVRLYQDGGKGPLGQSNFSAAYVPLADGEGVYSRDAKKALFASHQDFVQQTQDGQLIRKLLEEPDEPSVEYFLLPSQTHTDAHDPVCMADYLMPTSPENYLTVTTMLNHPFSRGSVHISSADVDQLPTWDPQFNSNPLDLEITARHVQFVETLVRTAPFRDILKPDGARIPQVKGDTLENAREVVRQRQVSCFHPSCSLAMKPREQGGVVDGRLRVYGTKGLRVVDASVFPLLVTGNIQSMVYVVAERAADIIKDDRRAQS